MVKRRFAHIEARLERLIEGGFARLFRGPLQPREVALQLARVIEDHTLTDPQGQEIAPNHYVIAVNMADHKILMAQTPDLAQQLAERVRAYCLEMTLQLAHYPVITIVADPQIPSQTTRIQAEHRSDTRQATQTMKPVDLPEAGTRPPLDAQLIMNDNRAIPLDRAIFNIGRRPDNHLVLDDPQVSRHHVQLRLRLEHYVLYDTGSRGGTYVNEQQVNEHILSPGDVIQIGNTSLIYMAEDQNEFTGDTRLDMPPPNLSEGR